MTTPTQEFDAAMRAVADAKTALQRLETLRDRYDAEVDLLDQERDQLYKQLSSAMLDCDLGTMTADEAERLRLRHQEVDSSIVQRLRARDAAWDRIAVAEKSLAWAREALSTTLLRVGRAEYNRLALEATEAYEAFVRRQAVWLSFARATGLPWDGHCFLMHQTSDADGVAGGGLDEVARSHGIDRLSCGPRHGFHPPTMTLDDVRARLVRSSPR